MTMPTERYNAIVETSKFLQKLAYGNTLTKQELKQMAIGLLRHYPSKSDLDYLVRLNKQQPLFRIMLDNPALTETTSVSTKKQIKQQSLPNLKQLIHLEDQENLNTNE